jgi:hypothetical protein
MELKDIIYNYLFNRGELEGSKIPSNILKDCEKIKENYKIENENTLFSISQARDFIKDVYDFSYSFPDSLRNNAKRFDLLTTEKNATNNYYKITVGNIFKLMDMPFYKIMDKGRLHRDRS